MKLSEVTRNPVTYLGRQDFVIYLFLPAEVIYIQKTIIEQFLINGTHNSTTLCIDGYRKSRNKSTQLMKRR